MPCRLISSLLRKHRQNAKRGGDSSFGSVMRVIIVLWRSGRYPRDSTLDGPLINEVTPRCLRILPCQRNGIQSKKNAQQILLFRTSGSGWGRLATPAPRHYVILTAYSCERRGTTIVYRAVGVAVAYVLGIVYSEKKC